MTTMAISTEFGKISTNFNPEQYKTAAGAAKGMYRALRELATELGYNADREVWIKNPQESAAHGTGRCWHVCWECGPYEWALGAADSINSACGIFVEPYWSFSLCFYAN